MGSTFERAEAPSADTVIKLEDIDPSLANEQLDIQTCIVDNTFDWTFTLKDHILEDKEILIKLKLVKNLTSGEEAVDNNDSGKSASKVTWRFKLSPGQKVSRNLYLLDLGSSVQFDCRVATREV